MAATPSLDPRDARIVARLAARRPRVQCLTNTVAQAITANTLHALGARASMALHSSEILAMSRSADALLINLGTIDDARITAIDQLLVDPSISGIPLVLDPVFVEHSPTRRHVAERVIRGLKPIVKGNRTEITALADVMGSTRPRAIIETGPIDLVTVPGQPQISLSYGHEWMGAVTGLGCALGAVVAACSAAEDDVGAACHAALTVFGVAGVRAAQSSTGPGSFAVAFIDALAGLSREAQETQ
jgi:hydroxyethylthiazole kinase